MTSSITKKLDGLERLIRFRAPRFITILVDGTKPPDEAAEAALLQPLDVQPDDIVVAVKKFVDLDDLPRLQSVI
jgi:hypothetical protein